MDSEAKFYIELGVRIASIRNEKKISQEILADFLKLSRPSIANIEKGRQKPSVIVLALIANFLKVEIFDLLPNISNLDIEDLRLRGADVDEENEAIKESLNDFLKTLRKDK